MQGLVWDDDPKDYYQTIKNNLSDYSIKLQVVSDPDEFEKKARDKNKKWSFFIVDLMEENTPAEGEHKRTGIVLINGLIREPGYEQQPIFLVTGHFNKLLPEDLNLPSTVMIKSKSTRASWLASDIYQELRRRGDYTNRKKVFMVYAFNEAGEAAKKSLESYLQGYGVGVVSISPAEAKNILISELLDKMHDCAGVIGICTNDDEQKDGSFHPRLNVVFEMGMAVGFGRGINRLVIIQQDDKENDKLAELPSDMGGVLSFRFDGNIQSIFPAIKRKLEIIGVEFEG
jgi:predicted nucleotide-binding protein